MKRRHGTGFDIAPKSAAHNHVGGDFKLSHSNYKDS